MMRPETLLRIPVLILAIALITGCASTQQSAGVDAARSGQPGDWVIVTGESETEPVMLNAEILASELARLSSNSVSLKSVPNLSDEMKTSCNLILVGEYDCNRLAGAILNAHARSNPLSCDSRFVQEQGYIVDVYPGELIADRKVIVAVGWQSLGAVYAISHLRTRMLSINGELYLDAEESPASRHQLQITERPSLEERGIYYFIADGYDYPPLTPASWNEKDWEYWVDKAACAQFTHILFGLWGGTEYYFPGSPACYNESNRLHHERLRLMIGYAHRRGLKVTCLLTPSFLPTDIVDANESRLPFLRASGHYGEHLKTICQAEPGTIVMGQRSWKGSMALMVDVMGSELEWFKEADAFQIWFYDPGGCYCGPDRYDCKGLQDKRLMEQVTTMTELIGRHNPQANIEVHLWPMWILQDDEHIGWQYRDPFLNRLKEYFSLMNRMDRITVCDLLDWPGVRPASGPGSAGLIAAREKGFRTNGFIYTTGYEDGYCFVKPSFAMLGWQAAMAKESHVRAAYMYRYEEGSKYPTTFFVSRYLWNLDEIPMNALRQYVNWIANTSKEAADQLFEAFILIDQFTCEGTAGQDHEAKGEQIQSLVEEALDELPGWKKRELEWLLTSARSFAILGKAVEHREDAAMMERLAQKLRTLTTVSPSFKGFAPHIQDDRGKGRTRFVEFVEWLAKGWYQAPF